MLGRIGFIFGAVVVMTASGVFMVMTLGDKFGVQAPEFQVAQAQIARPQVVSDAAPTQALDAMRGDEDAQEAPVTIENWDQIWAAAAGTTDTAERFGRHVIAPEDYHASFATLIARCWDSVSNNTAFDAKGLVATGTAQLDAAQDWLTEDRLFKVHYKVEASDMTPSGFQRSCQIRTAQADLPTNTVRGLKAQYDDWFASAGLQQASVFEEARWDLGPGDQYHAAQITDVSAQGCGMYVKYSDAVPASGPEAVFFLSELAQAECDGSANP